jgi:SAM-dependent methyltransferase
LQEEEVNCPAAEDVNIGEYREDKLPDEPSLKNYEGEPKSLTPDPMTATTGLGNAGDSSGNIYLKPVYDEMHSRGPSAWFSDGVEERKAILEIGEDWHLKNVIEIGCGEGELVFKMTKKNAKVTGIDFSREAINKAVKRAARFCDGTFDTEFPEFYRRSYKELTGKSYMWERLVMQGVLEHLDNPFPELKWMMENLLIENGDVITSSPCFTNPRGIVWMTLDALGAVMSKTDLHYLNVWEFEDFCERNGYGLKYQSCDFDWGFGERMIADLLQRIPLALKDGGLPYNEERTDKFLLWLSTATRHLPLKDMTGATMVYKISKRR